MTALSACSGGGSGSSTPAGPGITLTVSGGGTSVTEGGASDNYTLVLASAPSADVIITPQHDGQLTTLPATLTFTAANWNQAQIVVVAAIDDTEAENTHSSVISHNVTSADARYHQFSVGSITVNITDNDTPGVNVSESTGSTQVTEGGAADSYTLALASQPTGDTVITLSFGGQITVSPTTLTFTSANWNTEQIVTVTAVNDSAIEGAHSATISHAISSADPRYAGLSVGSVTAEIIDDDTVTTMNFIGSDAVIHEGDGVINIPVRMNLNGPVSLAAPITATINTRFSTATNISDYTLLTGGVTFPTGSTDNTTQMVSIGIQNDGDIEALKSIELHLTDPNGIGATVGAHADYHIQLHDNDRANLIAGAVTNSAGYNRSLLLGINPANAVTQRLSGAGLAGFPAIGGLAFDINANNLYAISAGELLKINFYTGTVNVVGPTPISKGMAFSSNSGLIYGSDGTTLYSYDTSLNVTTEIGDFAGGYTDVQGLAFDIQSGTLYGSDVTTNSLLVIDISSACAGNNTCGTATFINTFSGVASPPVLAFNADNFTLYGVSTGTGNLYTIDTASGAATLVGALGYGGVTALTYDMSSNTLYGFDTGTRQLLVIDEGSGAGEDYRLTGLGDNAGSQLRGMAYDNIRRIFYGVSSNPLGEQYLVKVHPNTGAATSIAPLTNVTGTLYDLAYDPNTEVLYGVAGTRLYSIDAGTAAATQIGGILVGDLRGLAYDSDNDRLYASDLADDRLYLLDTTDGSKTPVGSLGFGDVEGLAYNASGDILYGINTDPAGENPRLIIINTSNGAGNPVGPVNGVLHEEVTGALAYDETNGNLYGANQLGLLQLNTGSGVGTTKGQLGLGAVSGLAYNPNSGVYYAIVNDADDGKLVTVDLATGTTTPIGNLGIACCVAGLAFNANNNTLYAVNTSTRQLLTINAGTGAASSVGAIGFNDVPGALAFDGNTLYGIGGTGAGPYTYELITINTGTGAGSAVAAIGYDGITALAHPPGGEVLYAYDATTSQLITIRIVSTLIPFTSVGDVTVVGTTSYSGIRSLTWRN
ncbi:MAG: Calx-beta domain-containing protein [Pseudomonadota bacterium]